MNYINVTFRVWGTPNESDKGAHTIMYREGGKVVTVEILENYFKQSWPLSDSEEFINKGIKELQEWNEVIITDVTLSK